MELAPLVIEWEGKSYNCRRVTIGDYSAIREAIRRDRLRALPPDCSAEAVGRTIGVPVLQGEMADFIVSREGVAFLLYRCCHAMDQRFTQEMADAMVLANDKFVSYFLIESKVIEGNPTKPNDGPPASSPKA
jgi:hypothetical protein